MPLNKFDLDMAAAHGCSRPDCDHKNHDGTIYLHGNCHPAARVKAYLHRGCLVVACVQCSKLIANVSTTKQPDLFPKCFCHAGLDIAYTKSSGALKITCPVCSVEVASVGVAEK